jgi:hypothetical protein
MRKPQTFFELQKAQIDHDSRNHLDIHTLGLNAKMTHYILHFAKYDGRLAVQMNEEAARSELRRTYTDTLLIGLSASNVLNMDLDQEMRIRYGTIPRDIRGFVSEIPKMSIADLRNYSREVLSISNGLMADAMEKRDHLDERNSREIFTRGVGDIVAMVVRGSYHLDFDFVQAALDRRTHIAASKVA